MRLRSRLLRQVEMRLFWARRPARPSSRQMSLGTRGTTSVERRCAARCVSAMLIGWRRESAMPIGWRRKCWRWMARGICWATTAAWRWKLTWRSHCSAANCFLAHHIVTNVVDQTQKPTTVNLSILQDISGAC